MSSNSKSAFGPAFFIRIGVLGVLLLGVGGAFAYDRLVLVPAGEQAVERVVEACKDLSAERAAVIKAAGSEPTSTETFGIYQIDDWNFGRILPTLDGYKVSVVYNNGLVTEYYRAGISDAEREALKK